MEKEDLGTKTLYFLFIGKLITLENYDEELLGRKIKVIRLAEVKSWISLLMKKALRLTLCEAL